MPKRKREDSIEEIFSRCKNEVHHALKTAKGFERQRQSKRLHDPSVPADKKARIENEVAVLKSLDLHQAAHAHLCSALLRIKSIADSPKLPAEIKTGIPKPDLNEEEKVALHNVTSGLSGRQDVKSATEKAIDSICKALGVPVPEKKGRGRDKKRQGNNPQSKQADQEHEVDEEDEERAIAELDDLLNNSSGEEGSGAEAEKAPRGDTAARTQTKTIVGSNDLVGIGSSSRPRHRDPLEGLDPMEITDEEGGGDSDGNGSDDESGELDPMEITSDEDEASDCDDEADEAHAISDSESESSEFQGFSDTPSISHNPSDQEDESSSSEGLSPPPKKTKKAKTTTPSRPAGSTFLPSLMGGYISGSESEASDLEIAPKTKNRRGQRARQAIWEKRFKNEARHVKKQQQQGRDAGWDARRGAVDGEPGKPWKRGVRNPLSGGGRDGATASASASGGGGGEKKTPQVQKRDDTGPLHPSWEARRKAKEAQKASAPFQGKKITFD